MGLLGWQRALPLIGSLPLVVKVLGEFAMEVGWRKVYSIRMCC